MTLEKLKQYKSMSPSRWKDEAEFRQKNKRWLRYSQHVAMLMLDKMEELNWTQKVLADKMGCTQQYVSKVLKGSENLSIETICKIEDALNIRLLPMFYFVSNDEDNASLVAEEGVEFPSNFQPWSP